MADPEGSRGSRRSQGPSENRTNRTRKLVVTHKMRLKWQRQTLSHSRARVCVCVELCACVCVCVFKCIQTHTRGGHPENGRLLVNYLLQFSNNLYSIICSPSTHTHTNSGWLLGEVVR